MPQFNYCSIISVFCSKINYKEIEQIQKSGLRIVYNEPDMSLEGLLIHDEGIDVHRKHITEHLTEICKTFSGENPYFMKSIFTKNDVIYNLRTPNLSTLTKINTRRFHLFSFSFRTSHLWNQLPNDIKSETVKGFKNKLVINWQEVTCSCASCGFQNREYIWYNNSYLLSIYCIKIITLF